MILIDGVFNHLKEVAIYRAGAASARAVLAHKHIPPRQQSRWFRTEVGEQHTAQLLNFIGGMAQALPEGAVGRLARHLENFPADVVEPTMIAAAQATVLDMAKLQRSPPVRAAHLQQTVSALVIPE